MYVCCMTLGLKHDAHSWFEREEQCFRDKANMSVVSPSVSLIAGYDAFHLINCEKVKML